MRGFSSEKKGFTLVEALVYIAILGIFSLLLTQIIVTYPKLNRKLSWKMDVIKMSRILDVKLAGIFDAVNDGVNPPYQLDMSNTCKVSDNPPISRCVEIYTLSASQFWANPTNVPPSAYKYIHVYFDYNGKKLIEDPDGNPNSGDEIILISANPSDKANYYVKGLEDVRFTIEESGALSTRGRYLNIYVSIKAPSQAVTGGTVTLRTIISASAPF